MSPEQPNPNVSVPSFTSDSTAPHIIEVTPETEQRHLTRRADDRGTSAKAAKFDQLMIDARFQFIHWSKLYCMRIELEDRDHQWHSNVLGYYEGQTHAYARMLWYADQRVVCPCGSCVGERMRVAEACEKVGGGE